MGKVVALVVLVLLAGIAWLYIPQRSVSASFEATPVATISGTVQSLKANPSAGISGQVATVRLSDGTIVEASVLGDCPVWVGQVAKLAVFQPVSTASKVYVVSR